MPRLDHRVLRTWRLESKFTPEEVCVLAKVSYPYLRALEDGAATNPTFAVVARIAAVYGRSPAELFAADTDEPAGAR